MSYLFKSKNITRENKVFLLLSENKYYVAVIKLNVLLRNTIPSLS